jgi:uncharacterized membrane protein YtjA (UPF0391 family)
MLRAAIAFFVIALIAVFLGANNIAGMSMELGKVLLAVFLVLAVLSFLANLLSGRGSRPLSIALLALLPFAGLPPSLSADENVGEKVENKMDEAKKDSSQQVRKAKKKRRDATGQSSVSKDVEDQAKNVGDDVDHEAKKAKNKVD